MAIGECSGATECGLDMCDRPDEVELVAEVHELHDILVEGGTAHGVGGCSGSGDGDGAGAASWLRSSDIKETKKAKQASYK